MKKMKDIRVFVVENGVPTEIDLSEEIKSLLEELYDKAPVRGLSRTTYAVMLLMFEKNIKQYREELQELGDTMYAKSIAFARAFDIASNESPTFFNIMMKIERRLSREDFCSKSISMRWLRSATGQEWFETNLDYKAWARRLFEDSGLKIGVVRMLKFFYSVIAAEPSVA